MKSLPVLLVGHCCHDTLYLADGNCIEALGGSVSYISTVLTAIGVEYSLITKVGRDFKYRSQLSAAPLIVDNYPTTHFIADFSHGDRVAKVDAVCEFLFPENIPAKISYQIGLVVGIVGEILPETIGRMATQCGILLCDIQGMIRRINSSNGQVELQPLEKTDYLASLSRISYLKVSQQELPFICLDDLRQKTTVLLTKGELGCTVYQKNSEFHVPAFPAKEIDSTGAGDSFLAGVTAGLLFGFSLERAVLAGNFFGALAVEQVGVPRLPYFKHPMDLENAMNQRKSTSPCF